MNFLYKKPTLDTDLSEKAQLAFDLAALASEQVQIIRTRVGHRDGRLENVAEHSLMLAKVAPELAIAMRPELDPGLIARYATLHDDVECYVGDTPTDSLADHDENSKVELEAAGFMQLMKDYGHIDSYSKLMEEYEDQSTAEARFVRAVDKTMVILIHFFDNGAQILAKYPTKSDFDESEKAVGERDRPKYGEFEDVFELRVELSQALGEFIY